MAVPARRIGKARKRARRTHFKLTVTGLVTCPNCGSLIKSHHVCPKCGYYAGRQVMKNGKLYTEEVRQEEANAGKQSATNKKKAKAASK